MWICPACPVDPTSPDVGVLLPLSRHLVVRYDQSLPSEVRELSSREAANINGASALPEADLVIASSRNFRWTMHDEILGAAELVETSGTARVGMKSASEAYARRMASKLREVLRRHEG